MYRFLLTSATALALWVLVAAIDPAQARAQYPVYYSASTQEPATPSTQRRATTWRRPW
jgi:hypothetical protein